MFNILLVEDEKLDREAINASIIRMNLNVRHIEAARTGFNALEMINSFSPDILLTDVKMPGINGFELVEKIKIRFPDIEVIFISGYDDFTFLKNAIKLDACEYILKPVDNAELRDVLMKVIDKLTKKRQLEEEKKDLLKRVDESKSVMKNRLLLDIIFGTIGPQDVWEKASFLNLNMEAGIYCTLLLEIDDYKFLSESKGRSFFSNKLSNICRNAQQSKFESWRKQFVEIDQCRCAFILSCSKTIDHNSMHRAAIGIAQELVDRSKSEEGISITVAVGSVVETVDDIYKSYNWCCEIIPQKMFLGKGIVLTDLQEPSGITDDSDFYKIDKELTRCLIACDLQKTFHFIDYLFDSIEAKGIYNNVYVQNYCINIISHMQLTLLGMNISIGEVFGTGVVLWDKLMKFDTILDIRQWMKNIFKYVIEHLESKNSKKNSKVTEKVIEFIVKNYSRDITIKEIASALYYSPNHLGFIFKSETGQGFSEYLNEYRMKKACDLLKEPSLKTYEIAGMVGYNNVNSFIKQFKLMFDLTPKEYRSRWPL